MSDDQPATIRMVGGRRMQCKDIPDGVFLNAVRRAGEPGRWRMRWNVREVLEAEIGPVPENLFMAKARKLIARGLMDGCACGCRGDFELPEQLVAGWDRRLIGDGEPEFTGLGGLIAAADVAVEDTLLYGTFLGAILDPPPQTGPPWTHTFQQPEPEETLVEDESGEMVLVGRIPFRPHFTIEREPQFTGILAYLADGGEQQ
jgi:hypothetical protein